MVRITALLLKVSGIVAIGCVILMAARLISDATIILLFLSLATGLVAGLVRVVIAAFAETQMQVLELLVAILVGSAMTMFECSTYGKDYSPKYLYVMSVSATTFALIAAGCVWAWSIASDLEIEGTLPRIGLMAVGWLVIPGIACFGLFVLEFLKPRGWANGYYLIWSLLGVPAIVFEFLRQRDTRKRFNP